MADNEPPERDMKEFDFIQLCKFRVSSDNADWPTKRGKLITCSSNFGLIFYGTKSGFKVVKTQALLSIDERLGKERNKVIIDNVPIESEVNFNSSSIQFMDVSGDGVYLAVVVSEAGKASLQLYDIRIFSDKNASPTPFATIALDGSQNMTVTDLSWNPAVSGMLAVCTSDGVVQLVDASDQPKVTLSSSVGATCFCWSPKGKQLLVGKSNGSLAQYDHGLAEKKTWQVPNVLTNPHSVLDVVWQSTFTFIAAYLPVGAQPSDQPTVILTSANKDKVSHINFYDVCFGNGEERQPQYFFHQILKWEMVLIASSNATEATIIGKNLDDKVSWEHWNLEDCSRAQLPLTSAQTDSFPVGLTVDYSPIKPVVLSESKQLPPCPVMFMLTTDGILLAYHLHYNHKDATPATTPAQVLISVDARRGVPGSFSVMAPPKQPLLETPNATAASPFGSLGQSTNVFGVNKPSPTSNPNLFGAPGSTPVPFNSSDGSSLFGKPASIPSVFGAAPSSSLAIGNIFGAPSSSASPSVFGTSSSASSSIFGSSSTSVKIFGAPAPTSASPALFGEATSSSTAFGVTAPANSIFGFAMSATPQYGAGPAGGSLTAPSTTSTSKIQELGSKTTVASTTASSAFSVQSMIASPFSVIPKGNSAQKSSVFGQTKPLSLPQTSALSPSSSDTPIASEVSHGAVKSEAPDSTMLGSHQTPSGLFVTTKTPQLSGHSPVGNSGASISQDQIKSSPGTTTASQANNMEAALDSTFTQNILDEIADFEKELNNLKHRSRKEFLPIGGNEEKQKLNQETESLLQFSKEIQETTKEQLKESQEQKNFCYQLFAMMESVKMENELSKDPHHQILLQSKKLDPASAEKLKSLQQLSQFIEFNLDEVNHVLDAQWQEHLDIKKKDKRLNMPTGDTIYKAIKNNNTFIMCNQEKLRKLEEQYTKLKLTNKASKRDIESFTRTVMNGDKISPLKPQSHTNLTLMSAVANGMTPEKISRLREFLVQRKVPRVVKSTTPANVSMSRIISQSPRRSPGETSQQQKPTQRKHLLANHQQTPNRTASHVAQDDHLRIGQQMIQKKTFTPSVVKAELSSPLNMQQAGDAKISPTSFSGVAYFKSQFKTPAAATKPDPQLMTTQSSLGKSEMLKSPNYEEITTDDYEEEDDYDDEDNGYEDEDEDEEEAEYASNKESFVSTSVKYKTLTPAKSNKSLLPSDAGTPTKSTAGQSAVGKDLFGSKVASTLSAPEKSGLVRSSSNGFAVPATKPNETSSKFVFGGATAGSTTDRTQPSAFAFGGMAKFDQKLNIASSSNMAASSIFGSVATPSKNVGFSDVKSKHPDNVENLDSFTSTAGRGEAVTRHHSFSGKTQLPSNTPVSVFGVSQQSKSASLFGDNKSSSPLSAAQKQPGDKTDKAKVKSDVTEASPSSPSPRMLKSHINTHLSFGATTLSDTTDVASELGGSAVDYVTSTTADPSHDQNIGDEDATQIAQPKTQVGTPSTAASLVFGAASPTVPVFSEVNTASSCLNQATKTVSSIFGDSKLTTGTPAPLSQPMFGPATTSVFGGAKTSTPSLTGGNSATSTSVFGKAQSATPGPMTGSTAAIPATTASSLFGESKSSTLSSLLNSGNTTTSSSIVGGANTTTPSVFGGANTTTPSVFGGANTTTPSVFGGVNTTTPSSGFSGANTTTASSIFSGATTTTSSSVFGGANTTTPSYGFGGANTTTPSSGFSGANTASASSIFGGASTTTSSSVFGGANTSTPSVFGGGNTTTSSVFGGANTTPSSSIFGGANTTIPSVFGGASTSTPSSGFGGANTSSSSIFGGTKANTPSSVFGEASASSSSLFGGAKASTSSVFGGVITTTSSSLFGGSNTSSPIFGGANSSASPSPFGGSNATSVFGAANSAVPSSPFGSNSNSSSNTVFGGGSQSLFGNTSSTFGQPANKPLFGGASSESTSTFGSSGNVFGATSNSSTSVFGGSSAAGGLFGSSANTSSGGTSLFGSGSTSGSTFGQTFGGFGQSNNSTSTSSSLFGQSSTLGASSSTGGSLFGGFGGLGGKPSEEKSKQNVFGTPQVFGNSSAQQTNSLFGSGGSNTFGNNSTFSSGPSSFASGAGTSNSGFTSSVGVAATGFGVSTQQNTGLMGSAPAFGTAPSFGSSAAFGSKPTFGSTPAFGSSPSFGSSFSSPSAGPGFGSSAGGFGSFASVQAPSFGQLAQASPSSTFGSFGSPQPSSQQQSVFGGSFSSPQSTFGGGGGGGGGGSLFGQAAANPGFGAAQSQGFGNSPSFGGNPAFNSYRG